MSSISAWALVVASLAVVPSQPVWLDDYGAALRQAKLEGRPLLVVIEGRQEGQRLPLESLNQGGAPQEVLLSYKLCRVDASTPYGEAVARAFKATTLPHTAIIDNTASVKLYWKQGPFRPEEWRAALVDYRSGMRTLSRISHRPAICFT